MKKIVALLLCLSMTLTCFAIPTVAQEETEVSVETNSTGGNENQEAELPVSIEQKTKVPEGYIGIYTAKDLDNIRNNLSANYILMNDIDLSEYENWVPIGESSKKAYAGHFDGNGYTICNLKLHAEASDSNNYYGLFGCLTGLVSNLIIEKVTIDVTYRDNVHIGVIAGEMTGNAYNKVENCYTHGNIICKALKAGLISVYVGGVVGFINTRQTDIVNCFSLVDINISPKDRDPVSFVGGVIGYIQSGNGVAIEGNVNSGKITIQDGSKPFYVGGIIGYLNALSEVTVYDNHNYGDIQAINGSVIYGGGIISYCSPIYEDTVINIFNNSNHGNIENAIQASGICAEAYMRYSRTKILISYCYNTGNIIVPEQLSGDNTEEFGGIVARLYCTKSSSTLAINNSYNAGVIYHSSTNNSYGTLGGILGDYYCVSNNNLEIGNCYFINNISVNVSDYYGAIIGNVKGDEFAINNCYYYKDFLIGESTNKCIINTTTALSKSQMQVKESFLGFDFDTVWEIGVTEGYPYPTLRDNPHNGNNAETEEPEEPDEPSKLTSTWEPQNLTLSEGEQYVFDGEISTTAKGGLKSVIGIFEQVSSGVQRGYIPHVQFFNKEFNGEKTFSLSELPALYVGQKFSDDVILTPGSVWSVIVVYEDTDGNEYSQGFWLTIADPSQISCDFDTSTITLKEGDVFDFKGLISTTAKDGLDNIQININSSTVSNVGIKHYRADSLGESSFDLSNVPSFKVGDALSEDVILAPGTSWDIQIFATDKDGNSIGDAIIKHIDIEKTKSTLTSTWNPHDITLTIGESYSFSGMVSTNADWLEVSLNIISISDPSIVLDYYKRGTSGGSCDLSAFPDIVAGATITYGYVLAAGTSWTVEIIAEDSDGNKSTQSFVLTIVEPEIEKGRPTADGVKDKYTITLGESLTIDGTVTAFGKGKLNKVTIKHNEVGTSFKPITIEVNGTASSVELGEYFKLLADNYPLNTVGTHEFVIYASADNFEDKENEVVIFTVSVMDTVCTHTGSYKTIRNSICEYENNNSHRITATSTAICSICNQSIDDIKSVNISYEKHTPSISLDNGVWICSCGYINKNNEEIMYDCQLDDEILSAKIYKSINTNGELKQSYGEINASDTFTVLGKYKNVCLIEYEVTVGNAKNWHVNGVTGKKAGFIKHSQIKQEKNESIPPIIDNNMEPVFQIYSETARMYNNQKAISLFEGSSKKIGIIDINTGNIYYTGGHSVEGKLIQWDYDIFGKYLFNWATGEITYKRGIISGRGESTISLKVDGVVVDTINVYSEPKIPELKLKEVDTKADSCVFSLELRNYSDAIEVGYIYGICDFMVQCDGDEKRCEILKTPDRNTGIQKLLSPKKEQTITSFGKHGYIQAYVITPYGEYFSEVIEYKSYSYYTDIDKLEKELAETPLFRHFSVETYCEVFYPITSTIVIGLDNIVQSGGSTQYKFSKAAIYATKELLPELSTIAVTHISSHYLEKIQVYLDPEVIEKIANVIDTTIGFAKDPSSIIPNIPEQFRDYLIDEAIDYCLEQIY